MRTQRTMNEPELFEIRVAGHLSENWTARFEGLSILHEPEGRYARGQSRQTLA